MADSNKPKETTMTGDSLKSKKAGETTSSAKTNPKSDPKTGKRNSLTTKPENSRSRPQSASRSGPRTRSASADSANRTNISIEARQEKVKQQREKQVEERKRKNEERRVAFEERRKQKQEDERQKWEQLKQMAAMHRPGAGRKLPVLPDGPKRSSTAGTTQNRPTALPKALKPTTISKPTGPDRKSLGSPARSSSSLSSDSSPRQSPTSQPKNLLSVTKVGSSGNINDYRRASTSNLYRPPSASTKRPSSLHADDAKIKSAKSHSSLAPAGRIGVKKAQSTSALHRIDLEKPSHLPKKQAPKQEKPKAGMLDEAAAKQALAERRKQAREEAERKAKLDLERQEEERRKKEEEEKRIAEEVAKEEERMRELAEMLKQQEEERLLKAIAEKKEKAKEEAARIAEEERQREEERKLKEEEERLAKIEAEKKAKEEEKRMKQEEKERQERRRRVEEIMARTRHAKTGLPNPETMETKSDIPPQDSKGIEVGDTKRKVSELLQKVKDRTEGNDSPTLSLEKLTLNAANVENPLEKENIPSNENTIIETTEILQHRESEEPKTIQEVTAISSHSDSVIKVRARISETRTEFTASENDSNRTLSEVNFSEERSQDASHVSNGSVNGHNQQEIADVRQRNSIIATADCHSSTDEEALWEQTETIMVRTENSAAEKLENAGIVAEGDNNPDSQEAKLWRVVEGSGIVISDVS